MTIVFDWNADLTLNGKRSLVEFSCQGHFIHRLKQSRTETSVQMSGTIRGCSADLARVYLCESATP